MLVVRSATFINRKDGEFLPVFDENRERSIFAVFERENDCIFVCDRLSSLAYRYYASDDGNYNPNSVGMVDDMHFEDILEVQRWGKVFSVVTPLCVDNAGVIERDSAPRTFLLTQERSTAEWVARLLESRWKRREEEEGEENVGPTISTIVVEMT